MYNSDHHTTKLFRATIEKSSDLFCVTDSNYTIIDTNLSFQTYFEGYQVQNNFFELISSSFQEEVNFTTKKWIKSANQYISINWQKIGTEKETSIFWLGKIDFSKKIESLEETGRMGKIGFWEYDIQQGSVFWSEEVYKIHEASLKQGVKLETGINYYHPDDITIITDVFSKALNEGLPYEVELRIITAKGNIRWVKAIGERVLENGKPTKVKGTFQDIHRTKIAEIELSQSKILLQQILDSLPVGIFWKDKSGVYKGFNKACSEFIGLSSEELIGKTDKDLVFDKVLLKKIIHQDEQIIKYGKEYSEDRDEELDNQEYTRSVELKKQPLFNENNEVFGILGVYIDNTNRLFKLISSLKRKNNELNELLFAVSHDLKEPLQSINRYAQLLKRSYATDLESQGNHMLDYILREAKRQYQQLNGLMNFLEIGRQDKQIELLDLNKVINDSVINNFNFEQYDFPEFEIIFNDSLQVFYNQYDLEMLFCELITNAIKFKRLNSQLKIEIKTEETENFWQIMFTDNGEGFDNNLKNKVFVIFQKLHNKYYYDGAGIGLSICKKIVEKYGGEIDIHSEIGEGTSIKFTIPKKII